MKLPSTQRTSSGAVRTLGPKMTGRRIIYSSIGVTALAAVGSLLGFAVQIVMARLFGASTQVDALLTASSLPLTLTGIFQAGIGYVFVPLIYRNLDDERLREHAFHRLLLATILLSLITVPLSSRLIHWQAPGLSAAEASLASRLQIIYWFSVDFSILAAFMTACLHAMKRFIVPSSAALSYSISILIFAVGFWRYWGIESLAWGYLAGSLVQFFIVWRAAGITPFRTPWRKSAAATKFLQSLVPISCALLPYTALPAVDAYRASHMAAGELSVVGYAFRLATAAASLLINGVGNVLFPVMSENAAGGSQHVLRSLVIRTLMLAYGIFLPLIIGFDYIRLPVLKIIFQHGHFTPKATAALALILPWYLLGALAMGAMNVVGRALYALQHLKVVAALGVGFVVAYYFLTAPFTAMLSIRGFGFSYCICWNLMLIGSAGYLLAGPCRKPRVAGQYSPNGPKLDASFESSENA